jgi:GNAT superfamily N-acetyltransferase
MSEPALRIATARQDMDDALIHRFLSEQTYWAHGIPLDTLRRALDRSLCFGGFLGARQVAFARVVTDEATFGYLADVFVLPEFRGRGYSRQLMDAIMAHPGLQGLRRFLLATADAHGLYAQYGFAAPTKPQSLMERYFPDIYRTGS